MLQTSLDDQLLQGRTQEVFSYSRAWDGVEKSRLPPPATPAHFPPGLRGRTRPAEEEGSNQPLRCPLGRSKDAFLCVGQFPHAHGYKMIQTGTGGQEELEGGWRGRLQLRDVFARCRHVSWGWSSLSTSSANSGPPRRQTGRWGSSISGAQTCSCVCSAVRSDWSD